MSLFIPIYIRLTPQSQPFNSTNPVLVEVEAPSEVHAPPGHYRQASEDNGGLPTLSYPLPGSSIRTPKLCNYISCALTPLRDPD